MFRSGCERDDRTDSAKIARLFVPSTKVGLVQVDNVVTLRQSNASSRIDRLDRQRQVSLRAGVAPGFALADRVETLRAEVARLEHAGRLYERRLRPRP
jgi:HAE1 family hydrophobic/amphiphilic exporter-1